MPEIFRTEILKKHRATYHRCEECGIIKPKEPTWLDEAYHEAITKTDIGLVSRNVHNRDLVTPILRRLHNDDASLLDVGGGYGMLCRLLRDRGWDCFTTDEYCENIFAKGHEPKAQFKASTLLAFEVFEHVDDPMTFAREQISRYEPDTFIFSTLTHDWKIPPLDWWYFAFETGQHISIHTKASLQKIAEGINWNYFPISNDLHIFTKEPLDTYSRILLNRNNRLLSYAYRMYSIIMRRNKSLMMSDYRELKKKL